MSNRHRDIHIHPLQARLKAVSFLPARQPCIGDSKERLLRIAQNWGFASLHYKLKVSKEQWEFLAFFYRPEFSKIKLKIKR